MFGDRYRDNWKLTAHLFDPSLQFSKIDPYIYIYAIFQLIASIIIFDIGPNLFPLSSSPFLLFFLVPVSMGLKED